MQIIANLTDCTMRFYAGRLPRTIPEGIYFGCLYAWLIGTTYDVIAPPANREEAIWHSDKVICCYLILAMLGGILGHFNLDIDQQPRPQM